MSGPISIFNDIAVLKRLLLEPDDFLVRPKGGEVFDLKRTVTVAAGVSTEFFNTILEGNEHARLWKLGMEPDLNGVVAMEDTVFSIQVNRVGLKFYEALVDQIGTGPDPTEIYGFVQEPGATIRVVGTNNHATIAARMFCRLVGWRIALKSVT